MTARVWQSCVLPDGTGTRAPGTPPERPPSGRGPPDSGSAALAQTAADLAEVEPFLENKTASARTEAIGQLVWALICSTEFLVNH